jgi:isoaspartyl peptidase/L-asparaginase-like protein (Ntn-hydrolase superfamily)
MERLEKADVNLFPEVSDTVGAIVLDKMGNVAATVIYYK